MKILKNIGKILLCLLGVFLVGYLVFCFGQA